MLIHMAKESGKTTIEIVRILTSNEPHDRLRTIAEQYATILEITEWEFIKIARQR